MDEMSMELSSTIESKLGGSPLVLSVLGQLVLIAAQGRDFSLLPEEEEEREKFEKQVQLLKDPSSFRASLRQVRLFFWQGQLLFFLAKFKGIILIEGKYSTSILFFLLRNIVFLGLLCQL